LWSFGVELRRQTQIRNVGQIEDELKQSLGFAVKDYDLNAGFTVWFMQVTIKAGQIGKN
jgi:hypothetical protein